MVTKHLQLVVSNELQAKLHLNDHLEDEFPPNPSHRQPRAFANISMGERSGITLALPVPPCSMMAQFGILQAGSCSRCCGQAPPLPAENFPAPKKKGLAGFAKDIPNHSPHLSSPISTQPAGVAAGWANSWFWNPQDFQAKVPWLWQASLSAPLPAFIWCESKQEQIASAKGLYLCWQETVKVRRQRGKFVLPKSKPQ